jgi:hypothetical protein
MPSGQWFAGSTNIFQIIAKLIFYLDLLFAIVIGHHLKNVLGTGQDTFPATVACVSINGNIVGPRSIRIAIISEHFSSSLYFFWIKKLLQPYVILKEIGKIMSHYNPPSKCLKNLVVCLYQGRGIPLYFPHLS